MFLIQFLMFDFLNLQWLFNWNDGPTDWKKRLSNFSADNKYKYIELNIKQKSEKYQDIH